MPEKLMSSEHPKKVLIVEDQLLERLLLRDRLRHEHLNLVEAATAFEAIRICFESTPDLIILDLCLPDMDGLDLIRILKDDPRTRLTPIITLSGSTQVNTKVHALDQGAIDFVTKPYDPVEFRARVRSALRTKYLIDLLEQQAHLDSLTGLANRQALFDRFQTECELSKRRGTPLSVLIADLDHFKQINDQHGHSAGDSVLRSAARAFRDVARRGDLVARYGGEEFVILAPDCDLRGGLVLANRLRAAVADMEICHGSDHLRVTTSVGAVSVNDPSAELADMADANGLLRKADLALYGAKKSGRNTVRIWSDRHLAPIHLEPLLLSA